MGGCQNYGPFWGILASRCRTILGTPKRDHNFDTHIKVIERSATCEGQGTAAEGGVAGIGVVGGPLVEF